jgi:predicted metalloendopeptidase
LQIKQTTAKAELPLKRWQLQNLADDGSGHQILVDHAESMLLESLQGLLARAYVNVHGSALTEEDAYATKEALEDYYAYHRAVRVHAQRERVVEKLNKLKGDEYNSTFKPASKAKPTSKIFRAPSTATEPVVAAVSSVFAAHTFHPDLPVPPMPQALSSLTRSS